MCQSLKICQLDERPERVGQRVERRAHLRRRLLRDDGVLRILSGGHEWGRLRRLDAVLLIRTGAPRAQPIDRAGPREHHDPAGHTRPARVVPGCIAPDLREHVLHDLFRVLLTGQDPPGQPIDRPGVAVVQRAQRLGGSFRHGANKRRIDLGAHLCRHSAAGLSR